MYPIPLMDQISSLNNGRTAGTAGSTANISAPERDLSTNKYCCNRCGRSYQHQATLVRHQRYECGIQASYPCDICNRKFKRRDVLKGHKEKCVNKVQAQAALASMASAVPQSPGHVQEGLTTPVRALSPSGSGPTGLEVSSPFSVRPEFHNQTFWISTSKVNLYVKSAIRKPFFFYSSIQSSFKDYSVSISDAIIRKTV